MAGVFKFEFLRIFKNTKNIIIILALLITSAYFTHSGVKNFKDFETGKEGFLKYESRMAKKFVTYDQYASHGFRILYEPSSLIVFFGTNKLMESVESNIDVSETIKVFNIHKGKTLFNAGGHKDFSGIIFIFGTLYMVYMGIINLRRDFNVTLFGKKRVIALSALSRLILLNLVFAVIFWFNLNFAKFSGISFSNFEINIYTKWCLQAFLFLSVFYVLGLTITVLLKSRKILIGFITWFVLIFIVPEIYKVNLSSSSKNIPTNESLNIKKFDTLMKAEKEFFKVAVGSKDKDEAMKPLVLKYLEEGYQENKRREKEFNDQVIRIFNLSKNRSVIFPTIFYNFLSNELSSRGYSGYSEFMDKIIKLRDRLMKYYIQKRYIEKEQQVKTFMKPGENIFKAESRLPGNFGTGVLLTLLYGVVLFGVVLLVLHYRLRNKLKGERVEFELEELSRKRMYFVFCKDAEIRERLFKQVSEEPGVLAVDRIEGEDIDLELKPRHLLDYLCHIKGVTDREKVLRYLDELGGSDVLEKKKNETEPEDLKKIYLAVRLADDGKETILVNKYLTGATRSFEQKFIGVLKNLAAQNKRALYLSEEYYANLGITDVTERVKIKSGGVVSINITKIAVSLR